MKLSHFLLLLVVLWAAPAIRAEEDADEKDVIVLTDKNFNETLSKSKFALVCRHAGEMAHLQSKSCTKQTRFAFISLMAPRTGLNYLSKHGDLTIHSHISPI